MEELIKCSEPKLTDGFGMRQLEFTPTQVQAIEKFVKRYIEYYKRK